MHFDSDLAPTITIVGKIDPSSQRMQDLCRVDSLDQISNLGRYLLISVDDALLQHSLDSSNRFLYHVLIDAEIRKLSVCMFSGGQGPADEERTLIATLLLSAQFIDHPIAGKRSGMLAADMAVELMTSIAREEAGELCISQLSGTGPPIDSILKLRFQSATDYAIPLPQYLDSVVMRTLRDASIHRPRVLPDDECNTFGTNSFYGHAGVFHDYCGVPYTLPINGQLQHGWVVPGWNAIVGENLSSDIGLVWCPEDAQQELKDNIVIGSPYLYLPDIPQRKPIPRSLLSIPMHGIHASPMAYPWDEYADWLVSEAVRIGAEIVTVCLHPADYEKGYGVFINRGVRVVSAAPNGITTSGFLHRVRSYISQHETITTNRISTAAFYAAHDNKNVYIAGPAMGTSPPDRGEEFTADMEWTRRNYPGFFLNMPDRLSRAKKQADEVLGVAFKRSPDELRKILWGWYYGK